MRELVGIDVLERPLLRLGRRTAATAAGCLRGLPRGLSLLGPFLGPVSKFIHSVFHLADAVGDLGFRKDLRKRQTAHGYARENGTGENSFRHHRETSTESTVDIKRR